MRVRPQTEAASRTGEAGGRLPRGEGVGDRPTVHDVRAGADLHEDRTALADRQRRGPTRKEGTAQLVEREAIQHDQRRRGAGAPPPCHEDEPAGGVDRDEPRLHAVTERQGAIDRVTAGGVSLDHGERVDGLA